MSDYVAKENVPFGDPGRHVYAHTRGERISAERVKANRWEDYVVGANTKEARQILAELTGEQTEETSTTTSTTEKKG